MDLDTYVEMLLAGLSPADAKFLLTSGALDFPKYDALVFVATSDASYALTPAYRQQLTSTFRDAQRFWDITSSDIQLMAMHGKTVLHDAHIPALKGGVTLNALAFSAEGESAPFDTLPDKLIFSDGILDALE